RFCRFLALMKSLDDSVELCTDNYEDLGSNQDLGSILPLSVCPWREDSTIAHSGWATVKLGITNGYRQPVETRRSLASEIDKIISGFVRGQSLLCLALAVFYASALSMIGLNHAVLIGVASGLLSFIPYLGSLSGLIISLCVAIVIPPKYATGWRRRAVM